MGGQFITVGGLITFLLSLVGVAIAYVRLKAEAERAAARVKEEIAAADLRMEKRTALHDYAIRAMWKKTMGDLEYPNG